MTSTHVRTSDEPLLLGLDVGSTNIKAAIFDPTGRQVALACRPMTTHYPRPGWAYYEPEEIWQTTAGAIREALAGLAPSQARTIAGLAVASMGEAGVPLDAHGAPTYNAIAWFDTRTHPQSDALSRLIGHERFYAITGLALKPIWTLCKLCWLRDAEPEVSARTVRWLHIADYVAWRLCGEQATDHSIASRTLAFDITDRRWSDEILREAGIPATLWAPLAVSGTAIGRVSARAAAETGLPTTAVVATGGHDHVVGALAAGAVDPGHLLNSLGTAEAIILPTERPVLNARMGEEGYTQGAHVVPGRYYALGGQHTCAAALDWACDVLGGDHPKLIAEAERVPPGSLGVLFLPYLRLGAPPTGDDRVRGAWVGLSTDTHRDALYRAVLEGLALVSRQSLEGLLAHTGTELATTLVAIGGVTRNRLLMRIKATLLDRSFVVAGIDEVTALGAALLGGIAAGVYRDHTDALATLVYPRTAIEPAADDVARYNTIYQNLFTRLYPSLRELNHAIHRLERADG